MQSTLVDDYVRQSRSTGCARDGVSLLGGGAVATARALNDDDHVDYNDNYDDYSDYYDKHLDTVDGD